MKQRITWTLLKNLVCPWLWVHESARAWQTRKVRQGMGNRQAGLWSCTPSLCLVHPANISWKMRKLLYFSATVDYYPKSALLWDKLHTDLLSTMMWVVPQTTAACEGLRYTSVRRGLGSWDSAAEPQSPAVVSNYDRHSIFSILTVSSYMC